MVKLESCIENILNIKYCEDCHEIEPNVNTKVIKYNGENVGIVEYYNVPKSSNILYIKYIEVEYKYRRRGIGKKVIDVIRNDHPDKDIFGCAVPESVDFWSYINVEFDEEISEEYPTPFHIYC